MRQARADRTMAQVLAAGIKHLDTAASCALELGITPLFDGVALEPT